MRNVLRIGLVGGPGTGKSAIWTAAHDLTEVVFVPEAPTLLKQLGLWGPDFTPKFDLSVDRFRRALEEQAMYAARARGARALLTDRIMGEGTHVYTGCLAPQAPLAETCLARYHALILVYMPPEHVWEASRQNNPARAERSYAEAFELHERVVNFVERHPRVHHVTNAGGHDGKIIAGLELIRRLVAG